MKLLINQTKEELLATYRAEKRAKQKSLLHTELQMLGVPLAEIK